MAFTFNNQFSSPEKSSSKANVTPSFIPQSPITSSSVFGTPSIMSSSSSVFAATITSRSSSLFGTPPITSSSSSMFATPPITSSSSSVFGNPITSNANSAVSFTSVETSLGSRPGSSPSSTHNQSQTPPPPPPTVLVGTPPSTVSETPTKYASTFASSKSAEETGGPLVRLELMVEKKSNRVMFAESNKDFIDILFSFLTLPIGSIVKMTKELGPSTSIGCMNNIHKSVENLEVKFFMTEACKELLISPGRSSEAEYNDLKLKIGENFEPSKLFYFCENSDCRRVTLRLCEFPNVRCHCGQVMSQSAKENKIREAHDSMDGVFVKGSTDTFLIRDDLQVIAVSASWCLSLLNRSRITDANELETQSITVGSQEVLQLLHSTLVSKTPLTDLIQSKKGDIDMPELHLENTTRESPEKKWYASKSKLISLKLFISKSKDKVLYAECGEDFVDFLFSFLTFPLGSIVQLFDGSSSILGIDNLYKSVKDLDSEGYIKSDRLKNMLIKPKLAPFHACENRLLDFEESSFPLYELHYLDSSTKCKWSVCPVTTTISDCANSPRAELGQFVVVNPKCPNGRTSSGGGFIKGPAKFMVTDGLDVLQLSAISVILIHAKLNVLISDVDTMVIDVGKEEALNLLKAALVSKTPLSDVFNQKCKKIPEEVFDRAS